MRLYFLSNRLNPAEVKLINQTISRIPFSPILSE